MNLYIATKYTFKDDAMMLARRLREHDLRVVSRWHDEETVAAPESELPEEVLNRIASGNHEDLNRADALVLLVRPGMAGSLVEAGCALGAGKRAIFVGQKRSTTCMARHFRAVWVPDEDACIAELTRILGRGRP